WARRARWRSATTAGSAGLAGSSGRGVAAGAGSCASAGAFIQPVIPRAERARPPTIRAAVLLDLEIMLGAAPRVRARTAGATLDGEDIPPTAVEAVARVSASGTADASD